MLKLEKDNEEVDFIDDDESVLFRHTLNIFRVVRDENGFLTFSYQIIYNEDEGYREAVSVTFLTGNLFRYNTLGDLISREFPHASMEDRQSFENEVKQDILAICTSRKIYGKEYKVPMSI